MSLHRRTVLRRRDGYLPLSGSVVESDPTPTASTLVQNTAVPTNSSPSQSGIPLVDSSVFNTPTSTSQSSTPTSSTPAATTSGNQISLGTVIGACVAALIALLLSVFLAFYCSKRYKQCTAYSKSRNAMNNASRRRSHMEAWKRMDDIGNRLDRQSMKQQPLPGSLGAMFHRTNSNASGEKSSIGNNRESIGTMQHFAKYHPGLAAEMASQSAITDVDGKLTKPEAVLHLAGRGKDMTPPISWDGKTVGEDSFFSSSVPSVMMATERATPPTMTSTHRWESAEVLHVGQTGSDNADGELQNPFSDRASSVKSSAKSSLKRQNPFFSAQDHRVKRTLLSDTRENPFSDANASRDSSDAIRSLIAALEVPSELDNKRIISIQSSLYSRMTTDDGDSAISVAAFPYPPSQLNI